MKIKLKVLGLSLVACFATSGFAVQNAPATVSGHFTSEVTENDLLVIRGTEEWDPSNEIGKPYNLSFQRTVNGQASGEPIKCTDVAYDGVLTLAFATTSQAATVWPSYSACKTKNAASHKLLVDTTTPCGTELIRVKSGSGTVDLLCTITVTHPECLIRITPQEKLSGLTYKTVLIEEKHAFKVEVDVQNIKAEYEEGICVFLGTNQTFHLKGSLTIWATDTLGAPTGITHTG